MGKPLMKNHLFCSFSFLRFLQTTFSADVATVLIVTVYETNVAIVAVRTGFRLVNSNASVLIVETIL